DLARRDFTINALAYDVHAQMLIDPLNGQADLKARQLRAVSEANLRDDPLRVLRGYRLAAQLDFEIEPATRALLVACAPLLDQVSAERVREELSALIAAPRGADWLFAAYRDGALTHWLPELTAMEAIGASGYHHLPLIEHTFEVVCQVDRAVTRQSEGLQADLARPVTGMRSVQTLVKWAALLHDIAKPATWKVDPETGKTSFTDHENQGAVMSQSILQRLKFSRDEERWVVALVKHHLRPGGLAAHLPPSDRAVYRLCRDLGEMLPALLMLALADRYSTLGSQVKPTDLERFDALVGLLLGRYYAPDDRLAHPVPLLDGHGLMLALGLKPGPQIGKLLTTLQESQALGEVITREEAITLARRLIESG
ncbi:MAG: HDIG domain-containing protein, partial [Gemmatimonadaceae bacterium]|nr:HDIG domain-containing protein [Gloeobacterales cyanobacterium ES-bin-141]